MSGVLLRGLASSRISSAVQPLRLRPDRVPWPLSSGRVLPAPLCRPSLLMATLGAAGVCFSLVVDSKDSCPARSRVPEPRVLFSMARRSSRDITALVRHGIGSLAGGAAEIHPGPLPPPAAALSIVRNERTGAVSFAPAPGGRREPGCAVRGCLLHATWFVPPDATGPAPPVLCAPSLGALVEEQPGVTGRTSGSPRLPLGQWASAHTPGRPHRILLGSVARSRIRSDVEPSRCGPPCAADAPPVHPASASPTGT